MAYQVQVRGEFGGAVGDWRPAICGTLNQSGCSDGDASMADSKIAADDLRDLAVDASASEDDVRLVEVSR